jgi:hypothetical protein
MEDDIKVHIWESRCVYWIRLYQNTVKFLGFPKEYNGGKDLVIVIFVQESTVNVVSSDSSTL